MTPQSYGALPRIPTVFRTWGLAEADHPEELVGTWESQTDEDQAMRMSLGPAGGLYVRQTFTFEEGQEALVESFGSWSVEDGSLYLDIAEAWISADGEREQVENPESGSLGTYEVDGDTLTLRLDEDVLSFQRISRTAVRSRSWGEVKGGYAAP